MMNKEDMLKKLADCVCDMEDEEIVDAVQEYLAAGYDPQEGLLNGLVEGMRRASELYEEGEYFVPELIVCSDAMYTKGITRRCTGNNWQSCYWCCGR